MKKDWNIFVSSIFFVLGFTLVFSVVGVLLQTTFSSVSYTAQLWLSRIGGIIIILFGLFLLGLLKIPFLDRTKKVEVHKKFRNHYITSFVLGSAFAVGWSPCVGAILGAVLTLAVIDPGMGFLLLFSYSLGIGIPFLIAGLFAHHAGEWIRKSRKVLQYAQYIFGVLMIITGVLILLSKLQQLSHFGWAGSLAVQVDANLANAGVSMGIAFVAGLVSFLSPCVLPLVPAYLTYLGGLAVHRNT